MTHSIIVFIVFILITLFAVALNLSGNKPLKRKLTNDELLSVNFHFPHFTISEYTDGEYLEILDINKNPIAKIAIEDINNGNTAKIHKI